MVDVSGLNYPMLDHEKVLIVEVHLVEDVHFILKINVMNVVIEDIMLVTAAVLKAEDAGIIIVYLISLRLHSYNCILYGEVLFINF